MTSDHRSRGLHRSGRTGTAWPELLGNHRHPLQQSPDNAEAARDDPRRAADRHRTDRATHPRYRRRHPAPAFPAVPVVVDRRSGCSGHRGIGVVALRRRQHLRRRLHPDHGAGVRTRRIHGQLLPLVRHTRGAVRLVLRPAGAVGTRQHDQHLDATADPGDGVDVLVGDQPRSHPAPWSRGQDAAERRPGPRRACSWRPGCRSTTACGPSRSSPWASC